MAEKGIVVKDAASGESVACRDAVVQDNDANDRIVQLIDKAARPVVYQRTTAIRANVSVDDPADIDPLPAGISSNLVDVSDAEGIAVWATVSLGSTASGTLEVVVTPVVVSDDATPVAVAVLAPMILRPCDPSGTPAIATVLKLNGGASLPSVLLSMIATTPTYGAKKLGLHVTLNGTSSGTVSVFAAPMSCAGRDGAIDDKVMADKWGVSFPGVV
jgi:hypothetical protein